MKKRILALSLAAAMLVGAMASCSAKEEVVSSTGDAAEARDISLTLWGSPEDQGFLKVITAEWGAKYAAENADVKSVTVDVQIMDEDKAPGNAMNDIAAAADVFGIPSNDFKALRDNNAIFPISEGVASQVKEIIGDTIVWNSTLWEGQCWGIPYTPNNASVLYYNKENLSEADVKSLNTIIEKGALGFESSGGWHDMMWFATSGAELYTAQNKDVNTLNNDNNVKLLAWLGTQMKDGKIIRSDGADNLANAMKDGQLIAAIEGSWASKKFSTALGDKLGVAELPCMTVEGTDIKDKHMICFGGSKMNVVNAQSKEPEAAMALAFYIGSEDSQVKRFLLAGKCPATLSLAESNPDIAADPVVAADLKQGAYNLNCSPLVNVSQYWGEVGGLVEAIKGGTVNGEEAIKEKLDTAVTNMQANVNK